MKKILFTTDCLPEGMVVTESFGMIQFTGAVEVSKKGFIRGMLGKTTNEYQEIMDSFSGCAPIEANAILGVQISTSSQQFGKAIFMHVTYIGTPAIIENR